MMVSPRVWVGLPQLVATGLQPVPWYGQSFTNIDAAPGAFRSTDAGSRASQEFSLAPLVV
jgi:hypothetical protein